MRENVGVGSFGEGALGVLEAPLAEAESNLQRRFFFFLLGDGSQIFGWIDLRYRGGRFAALQGPRRGREVGEAGSGGRRRSEGVRRNRGVVVFEGAGAGGETRRVLWCAVTVIEQRCER